MTRHSALRSPVAYLLRAERLRAGLKQSELALRLGVPQSFVSKYETGERRLEFSEVQSICAALGLSLVDFAKIFEAQQEGLNAGTAGISKQG